MTDRYTADRYIEDRTVPAYGLSHRGIFWLAAITGLAAFWVLAFQAVGFIAN